MTETVIDLEKQKQAKIYERIKRRLMLVDLLLGAVYVVAWLAFDWAHALKQSLLNLTQSDWLLVAIFGGIFGALYLLIDLPLSYYSGFVLPHRFQLSVQTLRGWISDQIKGLILAGIFGLVVLEVIYAVLRASPDLWWLWAAIILLLFEVILANLAPILIFPIFFKFAPLGDEYKELADRLIALADRAGAHVRGVYKFDMSRRTKEANAALTGLGNTRRIILGDTLLTEFTTDEIETVMAHELGHHVNKDVPLGIAVESVLTLVGLYLTGLFLKWGVAAFGFAGTADIAALPVFALAISFYGLLTMPIGNAFSRWREHRADEYALQVTHNGAAFASAFTRLANQNLSDVDPEPWVEWLLYSHPALSKRIALAEKYKP
jgi:STE24 endopeptidase